MNTVLVEAFSHYLKLTGSSLDGLTFVQKFTTLSLLAISTDAKQVIPIMSLHPIMEILHSHC